MLGDVTSIPMVSLNRNVNFSVQLRCVSAAHSYLEVLFLKQRINYLFTTAVNNSFFLFFFSSVFPLYWPCKQWDFVLFKLLGMMHHILIIYNYISKIKSCLYHSFKHHLRKERFYRKVWKVDSAQGALERVTNNLLVSTPDKW